MSGATSAYLGATLSEFSIKFRLYGSQNPPSPDWKAWNAFQAKVLMKPPGGEQAKSLDIWHPELERLKIKSVGVVEVGQAYQSEQGEWTIEVKFIEWSRPKIAYAKPEGSTATETDPYDKIIDNNTQRIQLEEAAGGRGAYRDVSQYNPR